MGGPNPIIKWTPDLYSKFASRFDLMAPTFFSMGENAKEKVAEELPSGSVLDIACRTGALLAMAQEEGLDFYGIDTAPGMIEVAWKKVSQGSFKIASFHHIPFADASFDNVI